MGDDLKAAREIVVEVWLDSGICPEQYAENIEAVRAGKHDHNNTVKMALAGIRYGRGDHPQDIAQDTIPGSDMGKGE